MNDTDLEPLAADVLEVLQAERRRPDLAAEQHHALSERIRLAVATSLAAPSPSPSPSEPPAPSLAAPTLASGVATKVGVALFAAGALTGGIAGAGLHAALTIPEEPRPAPVPVRAQRPVEVPPLPPQPLPAPKLPHVEAKRPAPKPTTSPKRESDVELAEERALLEVARTALARGNAAEALDAVNRHASHFKTARLAEERESLAIQALLALGREADARQRAEDFRRRFPESMLLPLIDSLAPP